MVTIFYTCVKAEKSLLRIDPKLTLIKVNHSMSFLSLHRYFYEMYVIFSLI
jgi:hypothetical protein